MELINRGDHQKLYLQLYGILKKKIESEEWAINSQIPTEEDLCAMFCVSRATVRTAVLELVRHGYLSAVEAGYSACRRTRQPYS